MKTLSCPASNDCGNPDTTAQKGGGKNDAATKLNVRKCESYHNSTTETKLDCE
jgi:hypothetical protein